MCRTRMLRMRTTSLNCSGTLITPQRSREDHRDSTCVTERIDPKRRAENEDDMEDDSTDKRMRPRSLTVSYRTDAESVESNADMGEGDLSMLDETDKKI